MDKHDEVFRKKVIGKWKERSHPKDAVEPHLKLQRNSPPNLKNDDVQKAHQSPPSQPVHNCPKRVYSVLRAPSPAICAASTPSSNGKNTKTEPQTLKNKKRKLKKKRRKEHLKGETSISFTYKPGSD